MSFRELRSFVEIMKALGYPRLISLDSFRLPNFELVADCLFWLFQRYCLVSGVLALQCCPKYTKCLTAEVPGTVPGTNELSDAKSARVLGSEITQAGVAVYDALQHERELQDARQRAFERNMDTDAVEQSIQEASASVRENVSMLERALLDVEEHTRSLDGKLHKRRAELERAEKRLSNLAVVRPAYLDEYEVLQAELQHLFGVYLERFRNLEYLEGQLEGHRLSQRNKMDLADKNMKQMQKRLRNDELRVLRGEVEVDETHLDNDVAGLETSASEGELQPVRQAPANFVSVREQHSMHTTEKGGTVTGTLTGLLSEENTSDDSIIDDTGSESTHISKGITDDGDLFQDTEIGASLSDGSARDADVDSEASDF
ncbi:hypothetical protein ABBQ38_012438 [Trebouxia sp. C0009 RCD-2024]